MYRLFILNHAIYTGRFNIVSPIQRLAFLANAHFTEGIDICIELFLQEVKKIIITLGILDIAMIVIAICLKAVSTPLFIGILLGNIYALLNFALLGTIVRNAVERNPISAKRYMQTHYFIRWLLMGTVFAVAFIAPFVNGWCVVVSAFAPKLTYTALGIYQSIFNKEGKNIGN